MVLFDVAEEVLLRLSVKDLVRCKSVCKSWYNLISSPAFVTLHVKFICKKQVANTRIGLTRRYIVSGYRRYIPDEWIDYNNLFIEGSSNGLVCMSGCNSRTCLTNPSTREFRKLPKPPILPNHPVPTRSYGFGYDSSAHDYKLVFLLNQASDGSSLVQILSLKSNIWKFFGHVDYRCEGIEPGILFNGSLHWFLHNPNDIMKVSIVSFDLAKEQFTEIPQPNDTRYVWNWSSKLGTIQDHFCIFHQRKDGRPCRIWVMENYNVQESWKLLPTNYEMKDRVYYMVKDSLLSKKMPSYFCTDDIFLSTSGKHISSPTFVQSLVSPYHGRPNKSKRTRTSKEWREIEEAYTLKDGKKNAFHDEYGETDTETKKKRKRRKNSLASMFVLLT